jgi:hypothetical protein
VITLENDFLTSFLVILLTKFISNEIPIQAEIEGSRFQKQSVISNKKVVKLKSCKTAEAFFILKLKNSQIEIVKNL